ncbi:MAG TPA: M56 family metallopeptidase [Bryobacteraceae bacterium]|nr:M56 family metallopeptidase [Bryobacteraceae bacterium]
MIGELTTHVWQSTWFAVVAGLLTVAFRKNRAKVRYCLWFSASLKFLVPFALLTSLGSHLGWAPVAQKMAAPAVSLAVEYVTQPFAEPLPFVPSAPGAADFAAIAILGAWACGFLAFALIRLRFWLRIRAALRASTALEIPAAVEIRSSPGLLEPGVVGLWRPVLLLPEGIVERLTPSQLEAVLAHELCHVGRRDNLFAAIHMIVEAVFWFHPLVWWIGARLVEERERACDEGVLSLGSEPRIYADAILNVCKLYVESPLVCVSGVTGANLKRRIEAIMTNRTGQGLNRAKKFLLAGAGVVALAGPVAIGVVIGIGHAPAIRAQSPAVVPPRAVETGQAVAAAPVNAAATDRYQDRRLLAMLFDLGALTSDEQSRARQSALDFVQNRMKAADIVAVMAADDGKVTVVQDFTDDRAVLESAILKLGAGGGSSSVSGPGLSLSSIDMAARLLGALPGKKSLMYFRSGIERPAAGDAEVQGVIETAQKANVALFLIDVRATAPQILAASGLPPDENGRRLAYVTEKFGSASSAAGRTYLRYGQPDQIEDRGSNGQIWRYNYLENFRSNVEFEFTPGNGPTGVRINWPPPLVTYVGAPSAAATLVEALSHEGRGRGEPAPSTNVIPGLPGLHASFQIYPAGELQALSVPLGSLSGRVDIAGQIKTRLDTAPAVANVRDFIQASAGTYQTGFTLKAGSYVCDLIVREQATGRIYGETINFEVK